MKKIAITFLLFIGLIGYSQTNGITYQAVILNPLGDQLPGVNNTNAPLANKNISLKFSIIDQNSQYEYVETVQTNTDEFGMVNLIIGTGVQTGGYASSFSNILWNANPKRLKVDLSTTELSPYYSEISNQPFTAVPFALFAVNSESTAALTALQATVAANATATNAALALKENAINKSTTTTLGTSNILFPTQNAVKTYVDTNISASNTANTAAITALGNTVTSNATATTAALALKEDAINKSTTTTLGTSNVLFPTQNAVKTYVDTNISTSNTANTAAITTLGNTVTSNATATTAALALKEDAINKSTTTTLGTSNVLFPTQNAVKTYVDTNITTVNTSNTSLQATVAANATATTAALALKEDAINKSTTTTLGTSNVLFPTQNAVKTYVDTNISTSNTANTAAITTLGNTVTSNATATTAALALKEDAANKSTTTTLGTSDLLFPTQKAVKTYVDNQVTNGIATNVSGIVAIANGGTGSSTQNFVDLTTNQNIAGNKTFTSNLNVPTGTVGVGTSSPNSSAILDITSTTKGFLTPRMTMIQRNAISNPANGLIIYCTDCSISGEPQYFNGNSWKKPDGNIATAPIQGSVSIPSLFSTTNGTNGSQKGQSFTMGVTGGYLNKLRTNAFGGVGGQQLLNGIANSSIKIREYVNNLETGTTHALTGAVLATSSLPTVIDYSYSDPLYPYYPTIELKFDNTIYLNPNAQYVIEFITGNGVSLYCRTQDMYNGGQAYDINGVNLSFARDFPFELYVVNQPITPLTSGTVTYPSTHGTAGQVLTTNGSGTAIWSTPATVDTSNFVNLTTNQTIAGNKTFSSDIVVNGIKVGNGGGSQSTVIGDSANATLANNTALGFMTLVGNSGTDNTAVGTNSMRNSGATSQTTAIGENAGTGVNTGNNNTYLGFNANVTSNSSISNATAIGSGATVTSSNTIQLGADGTNGTTAVTNVNTSGSITANASISSEITANLTITNANAELYKGKVLICNPSSQITITFNNNLPVGFNCMVLQKSADANKINLAGGSGVTIKNRSNYTATAGNYAIATIVNIGGGIIVTAGDMQ